MNDLIKMIKDRASIRLFTDEPVAEDMISELIDCALAAPNGGNAQPWHFVFCTDKAKLKELEDSQIAAIKASGNEKIIALQVARNWKILFNAPLVIWITTKEGKSAIDAGIAGESMVLAAQSMGLRSCFIGGASSAFHGPDQDKWKALFSIPEGYEVHCGLAIGHPDQENTPHALDYSKITRI
ncbi:MAG: nitroreductase family protein [Lachnospiraceae bacterium]|nr:nitroreductase family protein [Lachnospiraceae bacterium]